MEHMSENLVKVLEEEGKRIVASATVRIEETKQQTLLDMEKKIKDMMDALNLQPLKGAAEVIELLERGGTIKTTAFEAKWDDIVVSVNFGNDRWIGSYMPNEIKLKKGKYRVTLIVEPLEEKP